MVKTPNNKRRKITTEKLTKNQLHDMYTLIYMYIEGSTHKEKIRTQNNI